MPIFFIDLRNLLYVINEVTMAKTVKIIEIPISELKPDPDNQNAFNEGDIPYLANSIKENGFQGAITVFKLDKPEVDFKYQILYGHRRTLAMKSLGMKSIPAFIVPKPSNEWNRIELLVSDNVHNRRMSTYDWVKLIGFYKDAWFKCNMRGSFDNYSAKFFNFSRPTITRSIALSKLIPALQDLTQNYSFPAFALTKASQLTVQEQELLYEMIKGFKENINDPEEDISRLTSVRIHQMIGAIEKKREVNSTKQLRDDEFTDKLHTGIIKTPDEMQLYSSEEYERFI